MSDSPSKDLPGTPRDMERPPTRRLSVRELNSPVQPESDDEDFEASMNDDDDDDQQEDGDGGQQPPLQNNNNNNWPQNVDTEKVKKEVQKIMALRSYNVTKLAAQLKLHDKFLKRMLDKPVTWRMLPAKGKKRIMELQKWLADDEYLGDESVPNVEKMIDQVKEEMKELEKKLKTDKMVSYYALKAAVNYQWLYKLCKGPIIHYDGLNVPGIRHADKLFVFLQRPFKDRFPAAFGEYDPAAPKTPKSTMNGRKKRSINTPKYQEHDQDDSETVGEEEVCTTSIVRRVKAFFGQIHPSTGLQINLTNLGKMLIIPSGTLSGVLQHPRPWSRKTAVTERCYRKLVRWLATMGDKRDGDFEDDGILDNTVEDDTTMETAEVQGDDEEIDVPQNEDQDDSFEEPLPMRRARRTQSMPRNEIQEDQFGDELNRENEAPRSPRDVANADIAVPRRLRERRGRSLAPPTVTQQNADDEHAAGQEAVQQNGENERALRPIPTHLVAPSRKRPHSVAQKDAEAAKKTAEAAEALAVLDNPNIPASPKGNKESPTENEEPQNAIQTEQMEQENTARPQPLQRAPIANVSNAHGARRQTAGQGEPQAKKPTNSENTSRQETAPDDIRNNEEAPNVTEPQPTEPVAPLPAPLKDTQLSGSRVPLRRQRTKASQPATPVGEHPRLDKALENVRQPNQQQTPDRPEAAQRTSPPLRNEAAEDNTAPPAPKKRNTAEAKQNERVDMLRVKPEPVDHEMDLQQAAQPAPHAPNEDFSGNQGHRQVNARVGTPNSVGSNARGGTPSSVGSNMENRARQHHQQQTPDRQEAVQGTSPPLRNVSAEDNTAPPAPKKRNTAQAKQNERVDMLRVKPEPVDHEMELQQAAQPALHAPNEDFSGNQGHHQMNARVGTPNSVGSNARGGTPNSVGSNARGGTPNSVGSMMENRARQHHPNGQFDANQQVQDAVQRQMPVHDAPRMENRVHQYNPNAEFNGNQQGHGGYALQDRIMDRYMENIRPRSHRNMDTDEGYIQDAQYDYQQRDPRRRILNPQQRPNEDSGSDEDGYRQHPQYQIQEREARRMENMAPRHHMNRGPVHGRRYEYGHHQNPAQAWNNHQMMPPPAQRPEPIEANIAPHPFQDAASPPGMRHGDDARQQPNEPAGDVQVLYVKNELQEDPVQQHYPVDPRQLDPQDVLVHATLPVGDHATFGMIMHISHLHNIECTLGVTHFAFKGTSANYGKWFQDMTLRGLASGLNVM